MTNIETNNNTANEDQLLSLFTIEELEERLEFKKWEVTTEPWPWEEPREPSSYWDPVYTEN